VIGSSRVTGRNRQTRKNRLRCEVSAGAWNRESGDRAEAVAVHVSASLALSQELAFRSVTKALLLVDGGKRTATKSSRSEVRWVIGSIRATGTTAGPEKTDCVARCQPGSEAAKAVIAQGLRRYMLPRR
jgi:hypothetical protein